MSATPSIVAIEPIARDCPRAGAHLDRLELLAELERVEPVVSAAVLAATAFRMRDHEALISALRMLVRATRVLEECGDCV